MVKWSLCQIALDPHLFPKERDISISLATMETVAFPKESDIATKPNLVQMVPLCQIALDPHLCLIGNDGNGGISKRE